ncbi:hypothetical protein AMTR_s00186p00018980, partial [Amborella trichopoda]
KTLNLWSCSFNDIKAISFNGMSLTYCSKLAMHKESSHFIKSSAAHWSGPPYWLPGWTWVALFIWRTGFGCVVWRKTYGPGPSYKSQGLVPSQAWPNPAYWQPYECSASKWALRPWASGLDRVSGQDRAACVEP